MRAIESSKILVVDDTRINLEILLEILGERYDVSVALNGKEALRMVHQFAYDLILLDIMMPDLDGYEVIKVIKESELLSEIPVIFISALSDIENKTKGFKLGAQDYIVKPFNSEEVLARVETHLKLRSAQQALKNQNEHLEKRVKERTKELETVQNATMMSFASLAEFRDLETGAHIKRIKEYARILTSGLRTQENYKNTINDKYIEYLVMSSPLHDIGKVGIPDAILLKKGKLTPEEFEIMKMHTLYGKMAIESVEKDIGPLPFLHLAKEIAFSHHEKWDGSGYPQGLKGKEIPLSGRIIAICDVFDGLVSKRVYKPPFLLSEAVRIILEGKGKHFDPDVVDAFILCLEEIRQMGIIQADSEEEKDVLKVPCSRENA